MADNVTLEFEKNAQGFFKIYSDRMLESIETYSIESNKPIRTDKNFNESSTKEKAENTIDENIDDRIIVKADESLVGPSGITLNQFSQPQFENIISILDIIRNETNYPVKQTVTDINIAGTTTVTTSSDETGCLKKALEVLSPQDKLSVIAGLQDKILKNTEEIGMLNTQKNKILKTPQFNMATIVAGVQSAGTALSNQTMNFLKESSDSLVKGYDASIANISGVGAQINDTISTSKNIMSSTWNDIKNVPVDLFNKLKIPKPELKPISLDSINKAKVALGENITCSKFNSLIDATNKAATKSSSNQVQSIAQKTTQQVSNMQSQIEQKTNEIQNAQELLKQIQL